MPRESIGSSIGSIEALIATVFVIIVIVVEFVISSAAEDAIWNGVGQALAVAGQGDLAAAWSVLGAILGIVATVSLALVAFSRLSDSGSHWR